MVVGAAFRGMKAGSHSKENRPDCMGLGLGNGFPILKVSMTPE